MAFINVFEYKIGILPKIVFPESSFVLRVRQAHCLYAYGVCKNLKRHDKTRETRTKSSAYAIVCQQEVSRSNDLS